MKKPRLHLENSRKIRDQNAGLMEPSGLACDARTGRLWTVNDGESRLFELDANGTVLSAIDLHASRGDYEGVAGLPNGHLAMVCEQRSKVVVVDPADGSIVVERRLSEMSGAEDLPSRLLDDEAGNDGLEGITFNPESGTLIALVERNPRLLIEIAADLSAVVFMRKLEPSSGIGTDGEDISGLAWDRHRRKLWIVSDTGRRIFLFDPVDGKATSRKLKRKGKSVKGAEGVAVSSDGETLFVVTDAGEKSRLLTYDIRFPPK